MIFNIMYYIVYVIIYDMIIIHLSTQLYVRSKENLIILKKYSKGKLDPDFCDQEEEQQELRNAYFSSWIVNMKNDMIHDL